MVRPLGVYKTLVHRTDRRRLSPGRNRLTPSADLVRRVSLRDRPREGAGAGTGRGRPGDGTASRKDAPKKESRIDQTIKGLVGK